MKYQNPIIRGFNPDPSICRVGRNFYLVTSSFEYFPGLPIYHSTDLVNWKLVGHCVDRLEQLPLDKAKSSGGVWAPTLRYSNGMFYVTATFDGIGNFIMYSEKADSGWSNPIWTNMDGIDPSMYFENGEMYYCANDIGTRFKKYVSEGISVAKMNPKTGQVIGDIHRVWEGCGGGWIEAPHIYKYNDWYYLMCSEGGTSYGHSIVIAKSKEILGPYVGCPENPILTNRNDTTKAVTCSGHGDFVEDQNGNTWLVHLGVRAVQNLSHIGRETYLLPVSWKEGWPCIGDYKKSQIDVETPLIIEEQKLTKFWTAQIGGKSDKNWIYRGLPNIDNYEWKEDGITLKGSPSSTFLAVRPLDIECTIESKLDLYLPNNGDKAGMAVYLSEQYNYTIFVENQEGKKYLCIERLVGDWQSKVFEGYWDENSIQLKIIAQREYYNFYYYKNNSWVWSASMATKFLSCEFAGKCFTGTVIGVFANLKLESNMYVKIKEFKMYR
jgi:alpha-N-arabinofuranosidase